MHYDAGLHPLTGHSVIGYNLYFHSLIVKHSQLLLIRRRLQDNQLKCFWGA